MCKKLIIVTAFILLTGVFIFPAEAFQAVALTDSELDAIHAGGFDFNLSAAYAFRASVIHQINMVALTTRGGNISNVALNSSNHADVVNQLGVVSTQENVSALVAKTGDIVDAAINNSNCVNNTASRAVATQQNVAVAVALKGDVKDTVVNNVNLAKNAAAAVETNIAVMVAGGNIQNSQISNANDVQVGNVVIPDTQVVNIPTLTNDVVAKLSVNHSHGIKKTNISVAVSGLQNRPKRLLRNLKLNKIVRGLARFR